jgi:hypothetical protein
MSGIEGFPCVFKEGCAYAPQAWAPGIPVGFAPYVVMSFASGTTLSALNLEALSQEALLGILLQLLHLLQLAQERIGPSFQHFDMHPDNIFVDTAKCTQVPSILRTVDGSRVKVSCPKVQLIDFDLVTGELFEGTTVFAPLPEQREKTVGPVPVPERTIAFAIKWLGNASAISVISATKSIANTDMRNWLVFLYVLWHVAQRKSVKDAALGQGSPLPVFVPSLCDSPTECLTRNIKIFSDFALTRATTAEIQRYKESSSVLLNSTKRKNALMITEGLFSLVSSNFVNTKKFWDIFDRRVVTKYGRHPNQDTLSVYAQASFNGPKTLRLQGFSSYVDIQLHNISLEITFKQLLPKARVVFPSPIMIGLNLDALAFASRCITAAVKSMSSMFTNTIVPFSEAFKQDVGADITFSEQSGPSSPWLALRRAELESQAGELLIVLNIQISGLVIQTLVKVAAYFMSLLVPLSDGSYNVSIRVPLSGDPNPCVQYVAAVFQNKTTFKNECHVFLRGLVSALLFVVYDSHVLLPLAAAIFNSSGDVFVKDTDVMASILGLDYDASILNRGGLLEKFLQILDITRKTAQLHAMIGTRRGTAAAGTAARATGTAGTAGTATKGTRAPF